MKIVICTGGREMWDRVLVDDVLIKEAPDLVIVGDCPTGADKLVRDYCMGNAQDYMVCHANWRGRGKAAGPERNARMVSLAADLRRSGHDVFGVAFPGGRGTADCVEKMQIEKFDMVVY